MLAHTCTLWEAFRIKNGLVWPQAFSASYIALSADSHWHESWQGRAKGHWICLGHSMCERAALSSCQGAILASVVIGDAPDVLVMTKTAELAGRGHPCSIAPKATLCM